MKKTLYKELQRKLRVTRRDIDTFKEYMDTVSEYRKAFNTWELPIPDWHSLSYVSKQQYKPWRKFSVLLKQWSAVDRFEF